MKALKVAAVVAALVGLPVALGADSAGYKDQGYIFDGDASFDFGGVRTEDLAGDFAKGVDSDGTVTQQSCDMLAITVGGVTYPPSPQNCTDETVELATDQDVASAVDGIGAARVRDLLEGLPDGSKLDTDAIEGLDAALVAQDQRVLVDVPASDRTVDKLIVEDSQLYTTIQRTRVVHEGHARSKSRLGRKSAV